MRGCAQSGLARLPNHERFLLVDEKLHVGWVRLAAQSFHQSTRFGVGFFFGIATEFAQQPALAFRQHGNALGMKVLLLHVLNENVIHAFQSDRLRLAYLRDVIRRRVNVLVAKHQSRAFFRPVNQADFGGEGDHACAFRADESFGDVEAALRKQLIEAIAGDAPRDVGIAAAYEIGVLIA